ncbi:Tetratricopeptide repeat protein [Candidatus Sulfotelmatobacter kueseliae]|uniref:Tetratricopeptide repeat protein n=1 Tax=Candidatus Sulfotelmatobacter kueseliae TaxID=2042962 RepID=A0A2U3L540_9BACT|nr:Tetratricopeptide repeat protein [Candidatus Sulfotelmatobacter kueseliae]
MVFSHPVSGRGRIKVPFLWWLCIQLAEVSGTRLRIFRSSMNRLFCLFSLIAVLAAAAVGQTSPSSPSGSTPSDAAAAQSAPRKIDRAAAYYHYALAHYYEEMVTAYGRSDLANSAIQEYRLAIEADPTAEFLTSGLAELYVKTGRIRDAVLEAQDMIKRDPKNLEAHKLLGRIYLRSLGDMPGGSGSENMLKLAIEQYEQIVQLEPNNVDNHLLLGRLYRLNNDMQKAETELKTAIKLDPSSEDAVTTLAILYTDEGDTAHALQVLSAVPDSARSAKLYAALGTAYEQRKDYKSAIDAYRHAVMLDRDNLDAIRGLADNLQNDGQLDAALEQYKVIVDSNPEDAQSFVRMAEIYRRQGQYDLALENLKRADGLAPDTVDVPYNMAAVYQSQGRYDDAIKLLQDLLKKSEKSDPNYSQAERNNRAIFLERLGMVYREQENYTAAADTFRKMLFLGDENERSGYQEIIDTYREAKQWPQATAAAKEAVEKMPDDRDLRMVLDSQLADTGEADKAIADVRSMLKGDASDREVYMRLGIMYSRVKRWKDAEEALNKAEQLSAKTDDKAAVWFLYGDTLQRQKKFDEAEAEFRKVLASVPPADPQIAATLNYLGYMNADRGVKLEESLNYIKQALSFEPNNGAYLDSLGWVYFKLGKYDLAEEALNKAAVHMGSDPTVQEHLGDLYQKTGRLKLAAAHWERSVQEWNKTVPAEQDSEAFAKVQQKLDAAKVKLAKEESGKQ